MLDQKNILAVIVLYKIKLDDSKTFQTLLKALVKEESKELVLLVFNNSPKYWKYEGKEYKGVKIIYQSDPSNPGVSKAYNVGYDYAKKLDKSFLLTLDQDTILPQTFFKEFFYTEKEYRKEKINLFCPRMNYGNKLVSPSIFSFFLKTKPLKGIKEGIHSLKGLAIINSGLIISLDLIEKVGGYNEYIKLDFSDFDFLKRAEKYTSRIIVVDNDCEHMLSGEEKQSKDKVLIRFGYYIDGAKHYQKTFLEYIGVPIWVFTRSIILGLRHKSIDFTYLYLKKLIKH